jgi:hypothetical protein
MIKKSSEPTQIFPLLLQMSILLDFCKIYNIVWETSKNGVIIED